MKIIKIKIQILIKQKIQNINNKQIKLQNNKKKIKNNVWNKFNKIILIFNNNYNNLIIWIKSKLWKMNRYP